ELGERVAQQLLEFLLQGREIRKIRPARKRTGNISRAPCGGVPLHPPPTVRPPRSRPEPGRCRRRKRSEHPRPAAAVTLNRGACFCPVSRCRPGPCPTIDRACS